MRTQMYRSIAVSSWWLDKAINDDGELTIEDLDETAVLALSLAFIWKGNAILATIPGLNIVEGAVVVGAIASYNIGGVEGVTNYVDFLTEPTKMPGRIAFTAETIYEHKIEPKVEEGISFGSFLYRVGERKLEEGLAWAKRGLPSIDYF